MCVCLCVLYCACAHGFNARETRREYWIRVGISGSCELKFKF